MNPAAARVIYPELPDPLTPGDLQQLFSPSFDERQWAPTVARTAVSQVALLVQLKIFQTIGRFRRAADVPPAVIEHVARRLSVESGSTLIFPARTLYRHRPAILKRLAVISWGTEARALAQHLEEKTEALAMSHDTFSRNTRNQLRQVFDALRELTIPPDPPARPIGFVTQEDKPKGSNTGRGKKT